MHKKSLHIIRKIYRKINPVHRITKEQKIKKYFNSGGIPWSEGYNEYKWDSISKVIKDSKIIEIFKKNEAPYQYGIGVDERIVEYPWIVANLLNKNTHLLDAGSTFNYETLISHTLISQKKLCIYTYSPESESFNHRKISYVYGDLRDMLFKNDFFDEIICQSTIEHIDMDNSIYGYNVQNSSTKGEKSFEYLKAIKELLRVLNSRGLLLLTFPYGVYENHGFFQQFDRTMTELIKSIMIEKGNYQQTFFKYFKEGWKAVEQKEADDSKSYNPRSGVGKLDDGAAHCRAICCIKFWKE